MHFIIPTRRSSSDEENKLMRSRKENEEEMHAQTFNRNNVLCSNWNIESNPPQCGVHIPKMNRRSICLYSRSSQLLSHQMVLQSTQLLRFGYWPFTVDLIHRGRYKSVQIINIHNELWALIVTFTHAYANKIFH